MAIRILIPKNLRPATGGQHTVTLEGKTAGELIEKLVDEYQELRSRLYNPKGCLRNVVAMSLNGTDIRYLQKEQTPVLPFDTITITLRKYRVIAINGAVLAGALAFGLFLSWIGFESPRVWLWLVLSMFAVMTVLGLTLRVGSRSAWAVERFGNASLGLLVGILLYALIFRLIPSYWIAGTIWTLLAVIAFLVGYVVPALRELRVSTRIGTFGAVAGSVTVVWIVVSSFGMFHDYLSFGAGTPQDKVLAQRRILRADLLAKWKHGPIAVTLSGGGYRAAVVEAGILSVFEKAGIPIAYLSSVSGGSIIGSAYALGWTPDEFAERLRTEKPHMTDDFSRPWVPGGLLAGLAGTGDVYVEHLARVYFKRRTLEESGPPHLIVNATQYLTGDRSAFWSGDKRSQVRPTDLATVAGASGAFPGVFSPVSIDGLYYMDGGVFENLGLEGLRQFLNNAVPSPATPRVLVICDVSAPLGRAFGKPSLADSALRAINIQSAARQQDLLLRYLGAIEFPKTKTLGPDIEAIFRDLDGVPANRFWPYRSGPVSVFYLTPEEDMVSLKEEERKTIEYVRNLDTLTELSHRDVDLAFWAGATLANNILPQICKALDYPCAHIEPPMLPH